MGHPDADASDRVRTVTGPDLKAINTFEQPRRLAPQRLDAPLPGSRMMFKLPPRSYTVAQFGTA
jgi:hypothetical protein